MALTDYGVIVDLKPLGGGWRYVQSVNGQLQVIPASFDPKKRTGGAVKAKVLVEMVRDFRINQGILIGDVEQDVADYIKLVSPPNDLYRTTKGISAPRTKPAIPIIHELREWVDAKLVEKPMLLTAPEATERAKHCLGCPQNIKWETGCGSCNEEVKYRGSIMRNLPAYPYDDALRACRLHRVFLPAAVFVDRESLPVRHPDAPVGCWMPIATP